MYNEIKCSFLYKITRTISIFEVEIFLFVCSVLFGAGERRILSINFLLVSITTAIHVVSASVTRKLYVNKPTLHIN